MRECHRILVIGGVVRLSTPDLAFLLSQYAAGRMDEWADLGWKPTSRCKMVNEGMRLWGHKFLYDQEELRAMLKRAGFASVRDVPWRQSGHPDLREIESRPFHNELIVEAVRAA